jgi:hypothetical protein
MVILTDSRRGEEYEWKKKLVHKSTIEDWSFCHKYKLINKISKKNRKPKNRFINKNEQKKKKLTLLIGIE